MVVYESGSHLTVFVYEMSGRFVVPMRGRSVRALGE